MMYVYSISWYIVTISGTIIEYLSAFTICISVMVNIRVKLWKVHHIQLPSSLKNPIQFDNEQQVHTI